MNIQRGFPDQCGGLAPLGELSASNATILLAPGLYVLGGFLFFGVDPKTVLFLITGLIFEVVALLAVFVLPLTPVHNEMLRQRERYYQEMATLAQRIDDNARELIEPSKLPDPGEIQKRLQILQALRQFYQENHDFPTWPFEMRRLAFALSAPQALSLLTGVGLQRVIPSWVLDLVKLFGK